MRLRNLILLGAALLVAVPAITTLPGCGGSSSGTNRQIFNGLQVNLGNGQTGTLNLTVNGTVLTGQLVVPAPLLLKTVAPKAIAFTIPPGTYTLSGTFTAPRGFSGQGTFQDSGGHTVNFTLTGQVPTTSSEGTFTFTANGQSVTGVIPPLGTPTPTPTSIGPTPTATTTSDKLTGTISGQSGANVTGTTINLPMHAAKIQDTPTRDFISAFEDQSGTLWRTVTIELQRSTNLAAGQTFTLGGANSLTYFEATLGDVANTAKNWDATSGTLRIDTVTATKVTFTLQSAHVTARAGDHATGSFNVNGTASTLRNFGF